MADTAFRVSLLAAVTLAAALTAPPAAFAQASPAQAPPAAAPVAAPTPGQIRAAEELDRLEPGRGTTAARDAAQARSSVERVALYEAQMRAALAVEPPGRAAGIAAARRELAQAANKELTPSAIARIDALLGLPPLPSDTGAGAG